MNGAVLFDGWCGEPIAWVSNIRHATATTLGSLE
jgi:hypothetical protein